MTKRILQLEDPHPYPTTIEVQIAGTGGIETRPTTGKTLKLKRGRGVIEVAEPVHAENEYLEWPMWADRPIVHQYHTGGLAGPASAGVIMGMDMGRDPDVTAIALMTDRTLREGALTTSHLSGTRRVQLPQIDQRGREATVVREVAGQDVQGNWLPIVNENEGLIYRNGQPVLVVFHRLVDLLVPMEPPRRTGLGARMVAAERRAVRELGQQADPQAELMRMLMDLPPTTSVVAALASAEAATLTSATAGSSHQTASEILESLQRAQQSLREFMAPQEEDLQPLEPRFVDRNGNEVLVGVTEIPCLFHRHNGQEVGCTRVVEEAQLLGTHVRFRPRIRPGEELRYRGLEQDEVPVIYERPFGT